MSLPSTPNAIPAGSESCKTKNKTPIYIREEHQRAKLSSFQKIQVSSNWKLSLLPLQNKVTANSYSNTFL
jgi:hypothetical protein